MRRSVAASEPLGIELLTYLFGDSDHPVRLQGIDGDMAYEGQDTSSGSHSSEWYPYESKLVCSVAIVPFVNCGSLRFCQMKDVPSGYDRQLASPPHLGFFDEGDSMGFEGSWGAKRAVYFSFTQSPADPSSAAQYCLH